MLGLRTYGKRGEVTARSSWHSQDIVTSRDLPSGALPRARLSGSCAVHQVLPVSGAFDGREEASIFEPAEDARWQMCGTGMDRGCPRTKSACCPVITTTGSRGRSTSP